MPRLSPPKISALIALAVVVWLASGQFAGDDESVSDAGPDTEVPEPRVMVRESQAEDVVRSLRLTGWTAPAREAQLAAETMGRIVEVGIQRGQTVKAGDLIARIDMRWRQEALAQAESRVRQAEIEYEGATQLAEKGFRARSQKAEAFAALESARANLASVHQDIEATMIRAPFDGVLHDRYVEEGDFVDVGTAVAVVVEVDPFIVAADVAETEVEKLAVGQPGRAELVDGRELDGHIRYIAAKADEATRTYRVELEVPNPELRAAAGMSADLVLPLDRVRAHRLTASFLSLDENGNPGIKTVDADDRVRFHRVRLEDVTSDTVLVTDLGESARIISAGQGFVREGDEVEPVAEQPVAELEQP